ncbi:class II glutamine amidotransferase [Rhodobacteraceae bacterium RKSG542]|nr:class II glutamine amidotransferase [Pseudovibrio flavus]
MEDLVRQPKHSLIAQSLSCSEAKVDTNGDGFGIGWYGARSAPGLYRDTLPAWGDENLSRLVHQIQSGLFFAHVRASTGTATSRNNCHPFAVGNYLFMHNGQIGGYQKIRRQIENMISDEYYAHRQGTTDSEALFLALLSRGVAVDPCRVTREVLEDVLDIMNQNGVREALRFTAALSDGERLYVMRYSSDAIVPSLYYRLCDGGLTVVSEPLDPINNDWFEVPAGQMIYFGGIGAPSFMPLEVKNFKKEVA